MNAAPHTTWRERLQSAVIHTPEPGQVLAPVFVRIPYAATATIHQVDLLQLSVAEATAVLATFMPAKTANTSLLVGVLNRLFEIALDVRNRSYVVIASANSASGAPAACSDASRVSNSSVKSLVIMDALSVMVVVEDNHRKAEQGAHPAAAQRGQLSIANAAIIMAMAWALAILGPVILDGAPDGLSHPTYTSYGYTPAGLEEGQAALLDAQARAACARGAHGSEGGYVALADGGVVCTDKRGRNRTTATAQITILNHFADAGVRP